jgi:hypothetical protein
MNPLGLVKNFTAQTQVPKRRIVKFGSGEGKVALATDTSDVFGVSGIRGAGAGERLDVYLSDIQPVECGALVTAGDYVTADASGRAIKAEPSVGAQMFVLGRAQNTGPETAICDILIQPQQITG